MRVQEGNPPVNGIYVAYVDDPHIELWAARELLQWHDGRWSYRMSTQFYRGHVYGWIGPLPAMSLSD